MEKIIHQEKESSIILFIGIVILSLLSIGKITRVEQFKEKLIIKLAQESQDLHNV